MPRPHPKAREANLIAVEAIVTNLGVCVAAIEIGKAELMKLFEGDEVLATVLDEAVQSFTKMKAVVTSRLDAEVTRINEGNQPTQDP